MTTAIKNCPECKSLILSDTLQCPSCAHVLNDSAAEVIKANEEASLLNLKSVKEQTCRDCGVSVRASVVRCWNCGAFMQENIEQTFRARQSSPQEVILSDISQIDIPSKTVTNRPPEFEDEDLDLDDVDSDFELSSELELQNTLDDDDDDFDLSEGTEWSYPLAENSSTEYDIPADIEDITSSNQTDPGNDISPDEGVDDEIRDFLKMVIREDAADFARKCRRNKTKSKKLATIVQKNPGGLILLPPCKCCKVKVSPVDLGKTLICPKCKVNYQSPESNLNRTRTIEANLNEQVANISKLKSFNPKTIALTKNDSKYPLWLEFVSLHEYIPDKTRNKPGILQKSFIPVDVAFSADNLLIIEYAKKPGAYAIDDKKIIKLRESVRELITAGTSLISTKEYEITEIPVGWLASLKILYPVKGNDKKLLPFEGVPIFGAGMIAIKFPATQAGDYTIALTLSQYRSFVDCCLEKYGYIRFAEESPLTLELTTETRTCSLSKTTYTLVNDSEYYLHDRFIKLEKVGGTCESCNAFISTKGDSEERIRITKLIAESKKKKAPSTMGVAGLANQLPKLPAKGKCILCNKNFGDHPAYALAEQSIKVSETKSKVTTSTSN